MNRIALALFAGTAAFAAATAKADTRGGFGLNVGIPAYRPAPPTVVYAPAYTPPARGYWKEIVVKTWVPERSYVRYTHWGRPERVIEPGYFTYRTDRVWVAEDHCAAPAPAPAWGYGYRR